ncbi:hypothetical protein MVLG_03110 [Microbotryum lychnidis-dioicae p1A1 Lamole]|uniref:Inner centromere protein ARK-binding domain-containing protein n=1 Tax=Microbotryum lychnidis-dioicae (strain p1A1 Lamole / MvSl-1064) TaxID=683840 RepID=U5H771_USTV1|nr:hypothetical protein MVLG_03110 [Microbotryum lychnidis-dioicae p1A1 Lamole]|eukprot:KDE06614.1 hypothetical protein MVLG_03110 [Microbotryum lychnidis-dioicae p1A1 Lamole]
MAPSSRLATSSMAVDHSTVAATAPPSHVNEPHHDHHNDHHDHDHDHDHDHHDHDQVHDVRHTLRKLALSTWQDHQQDVIDSHRWLEGFLESVQLAHTQAAHQGIKPAMSELMKTPGRKRTAANHGSALQQNNQQLLGSAARHSTKDPVATLLFPNAAQPRFLHQGGKENSLCLSPAPRSPLGSPRGSPGGSAAPPSRIAQAKSPLRTASPRPAFKSAQAVRTLSAISAMSPPTSAGKMAIDIAMDIDSPARPSKTASASSKSKSASKATAEPATPVLSSSKSYAMQDEDDVVFDAIAAAAAMDEDDIPLESEAHLDDQEDATAALDAAANAELSMIGEEEEELEDDHRSESYRTAFSHYPGSIVSTETLSQAPGPRLSAGISQGSQRVVSSSASSIAEEADADTAVPLNDAPSSLRNATATPLASSTSSFHPPPSTGTTQTPGGGAASTFSYSVGSYSAAKVGSLGLGNSPQASNASRKSIGNNGPPKPLKFVSIPKKSLGLGLVRNWATSSTTTDSQQSLNSQASSIGQVLSSAATTTTATGATKRKSMNDDGTAPPSKRTDAESATSPPAASGVNSLMNRMREMQSRQSTVSGASSRLSGISGSSSFVHKPLSNNLSLSVAAMPPTTTNGTAPSAPATSVAQTQAPAPASVPAISAPAPRPSVMDRVKSFERTTSPTSTSTASRLPLSPSRLGRAMSPVTRSATARGNTISPPQSPRMGMASSTFGQSISRIASPPTNVPTTLVRSPRIAAAAAKIVSPSPSSPVKTTTTTMTTRSSPAVKPKSPARVADMAMHKMRISTTPKESPPNKPATTTTTTTTTKMTNLSALMKDMDDVASSRLNAPVVKTSKSEMGKSTQTRYEDEEDEEMIHDDEDDDELLGQLPPRLEYDDADDESDGEGYNRGRTVLSQGQGKLAVAMDAEGGALKKSQSKTVMPGTFGAEDEEEEGDRSMEYSQPTKFKPTTHNAGTSSIRQPTLQKKSSHSSLASSQSSQAPSRPGSAMYGSVKGTNNASVSSHTKFVQAAERARQKQQEEADRKNAQKLEVQNKRAEMAQKKKAGEDRVRRDELERRRKEREERERKLKQQRPETKKTTTTSQSQPSQYPGSSAPLRPYPSTTSSNLNSSQSRPPNGGLSTSQPSNHRQMPGASSSTSATASSSMVGVKYMLPNLSNLGASSSAPPRAIAPPQFATKAFAPAQPPRIVAPPPQAEPYQELPEIDSEYSDSGDEEARAVKIAAMPGWAQSPALAAALYAQQQINPRDIFGPIPPLQMHEIFRNANLTRLTRRTSSACWEGTDALTADDLRRYEARMGYTRQSVSAQTARQ